MGFAMHLVYYILIVVWMYFLFILATYHQIRSELIKFYNINLEFQIRNRKPIHALWNSQHGQLALSRNGARFYAKF